MPRTLQRQRPSLSRSDLRCPSDGCSITRRETNALSRFCREATLSKCQTRLYALPFSARVWPRLLSLASDLHAYRTEMAGNHVVAHRSHRSRLAAAAARAAWHAVGRTDRDGPRCPRSHPQPPDHRIRLRRGAQYDRPVYHARCHPPATPDHVAVAAAASGPSR